MADEPKAPTPPRRISDKKLAVSLAPAAAIEPDIKSDEAIENEKQASRELAMIFELRDSPAFQWFETECLEAKYRDAEYPLKDPHYQESLDKARTRFLAMKEIRVWLLEKEIAHRETINPNDGEITKLREKLATL